MTSTILITGAGTGFGKGVAWGLAKLGHRVIAGVEIWPQVWQLRQEATADGIDVEVIKLDTTNEIDRNHAFGYDIDVLFNNAGVMYTGPITEIPESLWRETFDVNLFAGIAMTRGFIPALVKKGAGKIVWTSSVGGLAKLPYFGPYIASKHAIEAVAGILREEVKDHGITVQTVNPAAYRTGFNDTGVETMNQWFNPNTATIHPQGLQEGLENQYDPDEMIAGIIDVITGTNNAYRTLLPQEIEEQTKKEQAAEWDATV